MCIKRHIDFKLDIYIYKYNLSFNKQQKHFQPSHVKASQNYVNVWSHLVPMGCWLTQLHPTVLEVHELVTVALTECAVHRNRKIKSHNHTLTRPVFPEVSCIQLREMACWPIHSSLALPPKTLEHSLFFYTTDVDWAFGYKIQKMIPQKLALHNKPYIHTPVGLKCLHPRLNMTFILIHKDLATLRLHIPKDTHQRLFFKSCNSDSQRM